MKYLSLIFILLLIFSCSTEDAGMVLESNSLMDSGDVSENSPEKLAVVSSDTYMNLVNNNSDIDEFFDLLCSIAVSESAAVMNEYRDELSGQINETVQFMTENNDQITGYRFSETIYQSDGTASIYRIQMQKSGRRYYFKQDYKMENGEWKVMGDNVVNDFVIENKFNFKHFIRGKQG